MNYHGVIQQMSFADYKKAPGVSNSMLSKLSRSAAHLQAYIQGDGEETTAALKIGSVAHAAILETDKFVEAFDKAYALRPETYFDPKSEEVKKWHGAATVCKDWVKARESEGKTIITESEREFLSVAIRNITRHKTASQVFSGNGIAEVSMFCNFTLGSTVLRKARLDWNPESNYVADLKTCEDASKDAFAKSIYNYGYHRQAAFYLDLANDLGMKKDCFIFVAIEKQPPYAVACYQADKDMIQKGRQEYIALLQRYMECVEKNEWPAYPEELTEISLPKYAFKEAA